MRGEFTLARVIAAFKDTLMLEKPLGVHQQRTLNALERCRSASLGGHVDACPECGAVRISYNSCRNRHCPLCQGTQRERWIQAREKEILPVKYYHVVFTIPPCLHQLFLLHKAVMYGMLFKAAAQTVDKFARAKGVQCGMTCLLHTWGSNLHFHPHLHCIVPAGGMNKQGRWEKLPGANNQKPYLFPVKAMSMVFRGKFVHLLKKNGGFDGNLREEIYRNQWVVYCKRPFSAGNVIRYLGRYSHRVAITNRRIKDITDTEVCFEYKNYKNNGKMELIRLRGTEFLRRFTQHILPPNFVRIRHYGFLAPSNRGKLREAQRQTQQHSEQKKAGEQPKTDREKEGITQIHTNSYLCPDCGMAYMICVDVLKPARAPPKESFTMT